MGQWINLTTVRGDIILKPTDDKQSVVDVQSVGDLNRLLLENDFIYAMKPMSPKASPRLIKVSDNGDEEYFTDEEEQQAALGIPPMDPSGNPYMIKRDPESVRISYTAIGSVFNSDHIVVNVRQVISACLMNNQSELDEVSKQVYAQKEEIINA